MALKFEIPLRLNSIANGNQMNRWAKSKLKKSHHGAGFIYTKSALNDGRDGCTMSYPFTVTITRIGKRTLDDDNLAYAAKYLRDGIAEALGVDDGDRSKVRWEYAQETSKDDYKVRIQIK
jgi:hypothetical protein